MSMNKKYILSLMLAAVFLCFNVWAQPDTYDNDDLYLNQINTEVKSVGSPVRYGDFIVFTADSDARYVGISFDFEDYSQIHNFQLKKINDDNYELASSFYLYILKLPKEILNFNYRMVIDGIWTTDPNNPEKFFDRDIGIMVSHLDASREIPIVTEKNTRGLVRFIYKGNPGQKIRLGGTFTNWDSWIYELTEVSPGLYQIDLSLPPGTYDYAFYTGMNSMPDNTNPLKVYTSDGRIASRIKVD